MLKLISLNVLVLREQMSNDRLIEKFSTTPDWCVMLWYSFNVSLLINYNGNSYRSNYTVILLLVIIYFIYCDEYLWSRNSIG